MGPGNMPPPEGYDQRSRFGFLGFDNGAEDGRLARLGDVLRWLETAKVLPRDKALQMLVDRLPGDAMAWLYGVKPGTSAVKIPDRHMFGFHTQEQHDAAKSAHEAGNLVSSHQGRRVISTGIPRHWQDGSISRVPRPITPYNGPAVSEPGLPVLRLVLNCWAQETRWVPALREQKNTTDFEGSAWQANYLAVPLAKAAEWWGYGRTIAAAPMLGQSTAQTPGPQADSQPTWAGVVAQRLAAKGVKGNAARWTDPQCLALHDELTRLEALRDAGKGGKLTPLKQVAQDLTMKGYQSLDAPRERGKELAAKRQAEAAQADTQKVKAVRSVFGD
jgi:hypothetical protein